MTLMLAVPAAVWNQNTVTEWFRHQGLWGRGIIIAIFGLFLFGAVKYLRSLWQIGTAFERATNALPAAQPFAAKPHHLNQLWSEFIRTQDGAKVRVGAAEYSTVAPEDVFTEHAVLEGYNRGLAVTLAGVFTGLGILGTFGGLVIGMQGLDTTNLEAISTGAQQLIGGMSTAFWTSIIGIIASLLWLFADRIFMHRVQAQVHRFLLRAKELHPVESADRLLSHLLAVEQDENAAIQQSNIVLGSHTPLLEAQNVALLQTNTVLDEQKAILQTLGTDLATAFQNTMDTSLNQTLRPALELLCQTMTNYSAQVGESQAAALQHMASEFQNSLSQRLGGHFEGLARTLQETSEWHQRVHGNVEQLLERVQQATAAQTAVLERSTAACDLFSASLGRLGEMHQAMEQTSRHLEEGTSHVLSRLGEVGSTVGRVAAELDICARAVGAQAEALDTRIRVLGAEHDTYREANEQIRTHLATQIDALDEQVRGLTGFWLQYKDDLHAAGEQLRGSVAEFGTFTAEKLGEVFAGFDSEMARVVEHLAGTLAEVREVTGDLPSGVERLRQTLQSSVGSFASARESVDELAAVLKTLEGLPAAVGSLMPLPEAVEYAAKRVESTEAALGRLDKRIAGLTVFLETVAEPSDSKPRTIEMPVVIDAQTTDER